VECLSEPPRKHASRCLFPASASATSSRLAHVSLLSACLIKRSILIRRVFLIRLQPSRRRAPLSLRLLPQPRALPAVLSRSTVSLRDYRRSIFLRICLLRSYFGFESLVPNVSPHVKLMYVHLLALGLSYLSRNSSITPTYCSCLVCYLGAGSLSDRVRMTWCTCAILPNCASSDVGCPFAPITYCCQNHIIYNRIQSSKAFTEPQRAPRGQKQNLPADGRGESVAGCGPVRRDGELGPYGHSGVL
jgi:hypothetical protein